MGWRELINVYPRFKEYLTRFSYGYDDVHKKFLLSLIRSVPFFSHRSIKTQYLHELVFLLRPSTLDHGTTILKPEDEINSIIFVTSGCIEVITWFEGYEFILERLYSGSVVNFRNFFMGDHSYVGLRSGHGGCKILELTLQTFDDFCSEHAAFDKAMMIFSDRLLREENKFPLDYISVTPKERKPNTIST